MNDLTVEEAEWCADNWLRSWTNVFHLWKQFGDQPLSFNFLKNYLVRGYLDGTIYYDFHEVIKYRTLGY